VVPIPGILQQQPTGCFESSSLFGSELAPRFATGRIHGLVQMLDDVESVEQNLRVDGVVATSWRRVPTCPCTGQAAFGSAAYPSLQIVNDCKEDLAFCVGLLHRMPIAWDGGRARCGSPYATARFTIVATLFQFSLYWRAPPPTQLSSRYSHGIGGRPSYPRPRLCPGEVFHPPAARALVSR
jgi:hypothetical protein